VTTSPSGKAADTTSGAWRSSIRPVAEAILAKRAVPGLVILRAEGNRAGELLALGTAGRALHAESLVPVASITKLATALAVLRLVARGALGLDDPLARHLPEAAGAQPGVTVRALLCHTSGLPDDVPPDAAPYRPGLDWPALARACLATPPVRAPWTEVQYSNVGPGLLAVVVERLTGRRFAAALSDLVLAPLAVEAYLGEEPARAPARVAGDLGEHAGTTLEPYNSAFWRALALPWGGLVTTAAGALALVRAFAGVPRGFLPGALLAEATRDQTRGLAGGMSGFLEWPRCPWGLGVELRGDKTPHWVPAEAASTSFGHAGASGTLAWVDPVADRAWVLLGPRTIHAWWPEFAVLGAALLAR
jgi:CubicO group peptidase (beta-lactamase class C family)